MSLKRVSCKKIYKRLFRSKKGLTTAKDLYLAYPSYYHTEFKQSKVIMFNPIVCMFINYYYYWGRSPALFWLESIILRYIKSECIVLLPNIS